jgi:hypothetical protein
MAAAADLVIYDGQATPVAHTFKPARKTGEVIVWEERTSGNTPAGFFTFALSQNSPKAAKTVIKTKLMLEIPVEVLDSDTSQYSYPTSARFAFTVMVPKDASQSVRDDIAAYAKNFLADAVIQAVLSDMDVPY